MQNVNSHVHALKRLGERLRFRCSAMETAYLSGDSDIKLACDLHLLIQEHFEDLVELDARFDQTMNDLTQQRLFLEPDA